MSACKGIDIHVGTMGFGKMEGRTMTHHCLRMIERDEVPGPVYFQKWYGMKPTAHHFQRHERAATAGFFNNLGHGSVINTAGGARIIHRQSGCRCHLAAPVV